MRALHVAQIGFFQDPRRRAPEELLTAWPSLVDVAESASSAGVRTSVVQSSSLPASLQREGVAYHFLPFGGRSAPIAAASPFAQLVRDLAPDVFHVHGLAFPRQVRALAAIAPTTPIVLQDHADRVPRLWRWPLWRGCSGVISGVAFCAREQAAPFARAGLLNPQIAVYQVPESTSRFTPGSQDDARRLMRVSGAPLILWVGHLNENKDPLTVLEGVSRAARLLPELTLYCCFGSMPLLRAVERRIASDPMLRDRVHLLGSVSHDRVELLMRAADLFVLGSHREGSGYSLIEALACGLPPVVTDIPSFRALTGGGEVGRLWSCGDARALCEAILNLAGRSSPALRATARAFFDRELSLAALGWKLAAMYESAVRRLERQSAGDALAATSP